MGADFKDRCFKTKQKGLQLHFDTYTFVLGEHLCSLNHTYAGQEMFSLSVPDSNASISVG